jgi:hypothetical protein
MHWVGSIPLERKKNARPVNLRHPRVKSIQGTIGQANKRNRSDSNYNMSAIIR